MSKDDTVDTSCSCCASCGVAEIDDVKLMPCDGCDLVQYCSDDCMGDHKSEHKEDCKKRAAELRDELLFKQPESTHMGDCPICSLPLPLVMKKSSMCYNCSKVICGGCVNANHKREEEMRLPYRCPFCREPLTDVEEEAMKQMMKRVEANDPGAMLKEGGIQYEKGEYSRAFEYWTKAAELGDAEAHYKVAILYRKGLGVEKDEEKEMHHLEEAAIGGHPDARCNLGSHEYRHGNIERAVKHWFIAATQGHDDSIKELLKAFKEGFISKEDRAATLRAHHAAVKETKSPQRDEAEKMLR